MRLALSTTPQAIARRGIQLDRLMRLTLGRNRYAVNPGAEVTLYMAERTFYRPAVFVQDLFDRADGALGSNYSPWIADGVVIAGQQVTTSVIGGGVEIFAIEQTELHRDQWAECRLTTINFASGYASAGVGLRLSGSGATASGYIAEAYVQGGALGAFVSRFRNGALEADLIDHVAVPWHVDDLLRCSIEWNRIKLYRNGTLVAEAIDSNPVLFGKAGVGAYREVSGDFIKIDEFLAGPLRHEYTGMVMDFGDVGASLGMVEPTATPASWTPIVSNLTPIGGAARLSDLIRHGTNDGLNTYDVYRSPARLLHVIDGAVYPLSLVDGRLSHVEGVTEATARLVCQGRDAFLTPNISSGKVNYLPGPIPSLVGKPEVDDPCGADDTPTTEPGPTPEPPEQPPGEGAPEAPPPTEPSAGPKKLKSRVTYTVLDENTNSRSPITESDAPESQNIIRQIDRPLHGNDVGAGVDTHDIFFYRSSVIGVWSPSTMTFYGDRIRRNENDSFVWECVEVLDAEHKAETGANIPNFNTTKGSITEEGVLRWFAWGDCAPIVKEVPGTHIRLKIGVTVVGSAQVALVKYKAFPSISNSHGDNAGAPPDLDDTLKPDFNDTPGGTTIYMIDTGGNWDLVIEVGAATALGLRHDSTYGTNIATSVQSIQFFTPEEE